MSRRKFQLNFDENVLNGLGNVYFLGTVFCFLEPIVT